jgi:predicted phage-related endonuclease
MALDSRRVGRITASSAGAILGMAPYQKPADVMRRMVREYHGAEPEFTGNPATEYGNFHEAGAIRELEMIHGIKAEPG